MRGRAILLPYLPRLLADVFNCKGYSIYLYLVVSSFSFYCRSTAVLPLWMTQVVSIAPHLIIASMRRLTDCSWVLEQFSVRLSVGERIPPLPHGPTVNTWICWEQTLVCTEHAWELVEMHLFQLNNTRDFLPWDFCCLTKQKMGKCASVRWLHQHPSVMPLMADKKVKPKWNNWADLFLN